MDDEKYTMYGGQRGAGKIFFLEKLVSFLRQELEEVKQDRDRWKSAALYYMKKQIRNRDRLSQIINLGGKHYEIQRSIQGDE